MKPEILSKYLYWKYSQIFHMGLIKTRTSKFLFGNLLETSSY